MDNQQPTQPNQQNSPQQPVGAQPSQPGAIANGQAADKMQSGRQGGVITGQAKTNPNSTQNSLQIAEIRDGVVILKNGAYRAVVMAQSINFDLMSPQEREGVEQAYQSFINSLYFPVQITMRSQRVDLKGYLEKLDKRRQNQSNVLLSLIMEDYIAYIDYLSQTSNIMEKQFFVVVPYDPPITQSVANKATKFSNIFKKSADIITISEKDFNNAKTELKTRVQAVLESMNQMGVQAIPLNTQELIELYYDVYNPDTATSQPLIDHNQLTSDWVQKGTEQDKQYRGGGA